MEIKWLFKPGTRVLVKPLNGGLVFSFKLFKECFTFIVNWGPPVWWLPKFVPEFCGLSKSWRAEFSIGWLLVCWQFGWIHIKETT